MSNVDYRRSIALAEMEALSFGDAEAGQVSLEPVTDQGTWSLRADASNEALQGAVAAAFDGLSLPQAIGQTSQAGAWTALCLGPDEWMLVNQDREAEVSLGEGAPHHSLVNVSDQFAVLDVAGPLARHLLSKAVQIDLSAERFAVGQGARTLAAKTQVVVRLLDDSPRFRLMTRRSFAGYLWAWLKDASREYA